MNFNNKYKNSNIKSTVRPWNMKTQPWNWIKLDSGLGKCKSGLINWIWKMINSWTSWKMLKNRYKHWKMRKEVCQLSSNNCNWPNSKYLDLTHRKQTLKMTKINKLLNKKNKNKLLNKQSSSNKIKLNNLMINFQL